MRAASLLLVLCLGTALASAQLYTCGPENTPGGWGPIDGEEATMLFATVIDQLSLRYDINLTDLFGSAALCPPEKVDFSAAGCQQVVAGTNYKLWANATCNINGKNYTLGVSTDVFQPLPTTNDTSLQVYDVGIEFVAVDGKVTDGNNESGDSKDSPDRWIYDASKGVEENPKWTHSGHDHNSSDGTEIQSEWDKDATKLDGELTSDAKPSHIAKIVEEMVSHLNTALEYDDTDHITDSTDSSDHHDTSDSHADNSTTGNHSH